MIVTQLMFGLPTLESGWGSELVTSYTLLNEQQMTSAITTAE
jgi:hypothetical protein